MYDAKKGDEKKEKVLKYNCIADRSYYKKNRDSLFNLKTAHVPTENLIN
ncbi:MAG: hypothetical protein H7Y18_04620 [Clostridiaceae bacterium]|nr:hypothetical protein [Clostridiaceae bacterium]